MAEALSLDMLRERIRAIEGSPRVQRTRVPAGVDAVDELVGGLPRPGLVELCGAPGSGGARLAAQIVAVHTRQRLSVAWVDSMQQLYPPALADFGVELTRLLVVRPPSDGTAPEGWATEQLLRSGCFSLVVTDLPPLPRGRRRTGGHAWARAAEQGQSTALLLSTRPERDVPAELRLQLGGGQVSVLRDRAGRSGQRSVLPTPPSHADPWGC